MHQYRISNVADGQFIDHYGQKENSGKIVMGESFVSTMSVFPLLQCAQEEGIAVPALLQGSQLSAALLQDHERMLPFSEELVVVNNYLQLTREPHPGLRASAYYHYNSFGVLGTALISHPNLLEASRFLLRFVALTFTPFQIIHHENAHEFSVSYLDHSNLGHCRDYYLLRDLAFVRHLCREAAPEHWEKLVVRMDIAMPAPAAATVIQEYFQWPVNFSAADTRIVADRAQLLRPIRLANPMTLELMVRQCEDLLARRQGECGKMPGAWTDRVERLVLDGVHAFSEIARQLCCSERSLRRHLLEEKSSFQKIVLQLQRQQAIHYLQHTRMSIESIAIQLGYSETAAFVHAFKRWTGKTPTQCRQGPV